MGPGSRGMTDVTGGRGLGQDVFGTMGGVLDRGVDHFLPGVATVRAADVVVMVVGETALWKSSWGALVSGGRPNEEMEGGIGLLIPGRSQVIL